MIQCAADTYILDVTKFYNCYFMLNFALFHFFFLAFVLSLFFSPYFVQHSLKSLPIFSSSLNLGAHVLSFSLSIYCILYLVLFISYTRETFSFCFSCILFLSFNQTLSHIPLVLHSISQTQFGQLLLLSRAFSFSSTHLDDFFIISFTFLFQILHFIL
jgi:hypothetical protein